MSVLLRWSGNVNQPRIVIGCGSKVHDCTEVSGSVWITVSYKSPETTVEEYERKHGGPLYRVDPATCCGDRKIIVIERVLANFDAWMSGIRRDQSPDRANVPIVGWDETETLLREAYSSLCD